MAKRTQKTGKDGRGGRRKGAGRPAGDGAPPETPPAEPDEPDQTIEQTLTRNRRHLQRLQREVEAKLNKGGATATLLRESANLTGRISQALREEQDAYERLDKRYRAMAEEERFEHVLGWLLTLPVGLRAKATAALTASMEKR
jgi:hypothetical protein